MRAQCLCPAFELLFMFVMCWCGVPRRETPQVAVRRRSQSSRNMLNVAAAEGDCPLEVIRLELGQRPSDDTDCVKVEETSDGRFALTGTVLCQKGDAAESASPVGTTTFQEPSWAA